MKNTLAQWMRRPFAYRTYRYNITFVIIAINVAIFLVTSIGKGLIPFVAMNPLLFLSGRFWTVFTYMFVHADLTHLFFNMLGLFFFGNMVEKLWGSDEYMFLYGLIGTLSGIFSLIVYLITNTYYVILLGASGAIYGILLVFSCMFPYQRIYIFGIFPMTAKVVMILFIAIQIFSSLSYGNSGVAYFTHLSGIAVAWIYLLLRHNINPYIRLFRS